MNIKDEAAEAFTQYRRKQIAELRPYQNGEDMIGVSISAEDYKRGSPKSGDMIARNPKNHADQWLVAAAYFAENFEPIDALSPAPVGVTVADALSQLSDAIAREEKEREASDRVFTTLRVNIEKSEPTAEFAEALRDYWLKEGKPALASHEPAPTDTQEVVAFLVDCPAQPTLEFANVHVPDSSEPLVRQSALTACQQEVERLRAKVEELTRERDEARSFQWYGTHAERLERRADKAEARNAELVKALDQLLDDMGENGLCVCQAAKDQAIAALGGQSNGSKTWGEWERAQQEKEGEQ